MSEISRFRVATAVMTAVMLVAVGALVASRAPSSRAAGTQVPHLISMDESGEAMLRAGYAMAAHANEMLDESERTGDRQLAAHGEHWAKDAEALLQGAKWMGVDPKALSSLTSNPVSAAVQENWGALVRGSEAMVHNVGEASTARGAANLEALRWEGQSMVAEGRNMAEHGRVMAEEVVAMVEQHKLQGQEADELKQAAQVISDVGGHLSRNGQEMVDYADRLRRNLGIP